MISNEQKYDKIGLAESVLECFSTFSPRKSASDFLFLTSNETSKPKC